MMLMMQKQTLAQTAGGTTLQKSLQVPGPGSCSYIGLFFGIGMTWLLYSPVWCF